MSGIKGYIYNSERWKKIIYHYFSDIYFDLTIFFIFSIFVVLHIKTINIFVIIGAVVSVVGVFFRILSRIQLGKAFSVKPEARILITTGIYSKIRNPIYIFSLMAYGGLLIILGKMIFIPIFFFLIVIQVLRMKKESLLLAKVFGEEYEKYKEKTRF